MATQENVEYLALLKCKDELTSEISEDPLSVATALVAKGLIPESLHRSVKSQGEDDETKASELVSKVMKKIRTYPARFSDFLEVLQGSIWLEDVLKTLTAAYDALKAQKKKGSDTEDGTTTSTEGILGEYNNYIQIFWPLILVSPSFSKFVLFVLFRVL